LAYFVLNLSIFAGNKEFIYHAFSILGKKEKTSKFKLYTWNILSNQDFFNKNTKLFINLFAEEV